MEVFLAHFQNYLRQNFVHIRIFQMVFHQLSLCLLVYQNYNRPDRFWVDWNLDGMTVSVVIPVNNDKIALLMCLKSSKLIML